MNEARIRAIDILPRLTLSADFDGGAGAGGTDTTIETVRHDRAS